MEKKKGNFIIPPEYYRNSAFSIQEIKIPLNTLIIENEKIEVKTPEFVSPSSKFTKQIEDIAGQKNVPTSDVAENNFGIKVSAFSLSSIKAKKELLEKQKGKVKVEEYLPSEKFTETQMLEQWFKYAQKLKDKGLMIMESLLRVGALKLDGFEISYQLPNEGSKIDFEKDKPALLSFLRSHLHNHGLTILVTVNETIKSKVAFTAQDKYNRLNEINPNLELLRKTFDLDF